MRTDELKATTILQQLKIVNFYLKWKIFTQVSLTHRERKTNRTCTPSPLRNALWSEMQNLGNWVNDTSASW